MLLGLAPARQEEDTGLGPQQTLAWGEFLFLTCLSPRALMQADWMGDTGGIFLHEASKCLPPCSPTPRTGAFPLTGTFYFRYKCPFNIPTLSPAPGISRTLTAERKAYSLIKLLLTAKVLVTEPKSGICLTA